MSPPKAPTSNKNTDTKREMEEGARRGGGGGGVRSDHLRSRYPSHGREGGLRAPIGDSKGRSEMEEGRGTAWESVERGGRGRGYEML